MKKEIEIDVKDLFLYIRKRWASIALVMLLTMSCAFGVSKFFITPVYESQAMIYITSAGGNGNVVQSMLSSLQAGTALTSDYKTLATSKPVLEQVIDTLHLDMTYDVMKTKVSTENPDNTRILTLKVKDKDPRKAKEMVDCLTEIECNKIADIMNTTKPNVLQWGDIQTEPVSISPLHMAFNAGAIALIFMILLYSISFIQNDRIISDEDIEKTLGIRNLADIPYLSSNGKRRKK